MAQNELQKMIERYQKELMQYAQSAQRGTASPSWSAPTNHPNSSAPIASKAPVAPKEPSVAPAPSVARSPNAYGEEMAMQFDFNDVDDLDEQMTDMDIGFDGFDGAFTEMEGIYGEDHGDGMADYATDEEMNSYFSAYPEDMDVDQDGTPKSMSEPTAPAQSTSPTLTAPQTPSPIPTAPQTYSTPHIHSATASAPHTHSTSDSEPQFVGFLEVTARTGDGAKPVEAALVIVSSTDEKGERLEFTALTDSSGTARLFNLPASNPANTESPDMPDKFILYNVSISKPGYFEMVSTGVPLIGGITSRQDFRMIPLPEGISGDLIEFENTEPQDLN